MFTGIVERVGSVRSVEDLETTRRFTIEAGEIAGELDEGESVAVDGCCMTVTGIEEDAFSVDAIGTTLARTAAGAYEVGSRVNLERAMKIDGRIDGHLVQGHVDATAICVGVEDQGGSWKYTFEYSGDDVTVEKGSVTVNGTSLTVVDSEDTRFSVCIIPFTYEHTNFHTLQVGDRINLEFDILGKYVSKLLQKQNLIK